jgi:hypothetical protein
MLSSQVVVNLLPKLCVCVDLRRHGNDSNVVRGGSLRALFRVVGGPSHREGAECPDERTPKNRTQVLAARVTPGQLDHFTTLVFQQHG